MKDMMSQVKNFSKIALCTVLLMAAGCKSPEPENPFVDPGNTTDPEWVITVENNMTASMTAIVRVTFTEQPGTLAAFMGEDCCGIAQYDPANALYWLYITPPSSNDQQTNDQQTNDQRLTTNDIRLRFYSPSLKRIFDAAATIPFRNDDRLGTLTEPFTPEWTVSK